MELKNYQRLTLERLADFLSTARATDVATAFVQHQSREAKQPYHPVPALGGAPFICLKIPTGGGKTRIAAESVAVTARAVGTEQPVVLWLVPTKTIREQTLKALRNPRGPLRRAIEGPLGAATIMDAAEALESRRAVFDGGPVIIVTTLASVRREEIEGLKFYEANTAVPEHFENVPDALLAQLECYPESNRPIPSLANAIRLRKPCIVIDEAHNARTALAFQTFARFDPSVMIELTATPKELTKKADAAPPSNVLADVHAFALKAEDMIKLPVELRTVPQWEQTLNEALAKRDELEALARTETADGYLRPILLVQCERKDQELTWERVLERLVEIQVPREQIAVATGSHDELPANLLSQDSGVRVVLTVDKLREGWDCPFAYVLCALRDRGSGAAIEQTIGRVLRMPYARKRPNEELNRAYAFVRGDRFTAAAAAQAFVHALQRNGFDPDSASRALRPSQGALPGTTGGEQDYGGLFASDNCPASKGKRFAVPQLTIDFEGERETATPDHFLVDLDLKSADAGLPDYDAAPETGGQLVDASARGLRVSPLEGAARQHRLIIEGQTPTIPGVVAWLDRAIPHPELDIRQSLAYITRVVEGLMGRGLTLEQIWADRLRIRDCTARRLKHYVKAAFAAAAQGFLFDPPDQGLIVDDTMPHVFPREYEPTTLITDVDFEKHYYARVGSMNKEEVNFAHFLDNLDQVEFWVRNVERIPGSFWLPTSTDRFYPDFVASLTDGRSLIAEYKGGDRIDNPDTIEKEKIGQVYQERSDGRCLFAVVGKENYRTVIRERLAHRI